MKNAYATYARNRVLGASPAGLVLILLQEARRRVGLAQDALRKRQHEEAHHHLIRAQDIIYELRGAVDLDAGQLAHDLVSLYDFVLSGLLEANIKKTEGKLDVVAEVLANLASAWAELERGQAPAVGE